MLTKRAVHHLQSPLERFQSHQPQQQQYYPDNGALIASGHLGTMRTVAGEHVALSKENELQQQLNNSLYVHLCWYARLALYALAVGLIAHWLITFNAIHSKNVTEKTHCDDEWGAKYKDAERPSRPKEQRLYDDCHVLWDNNLWLLSLEQWFVKEVEDHWAPVLKALFVACVSISTVMMAAVKLGLTCCNNLRHGRYGSRRRHHQA